MNQTTEEPIEDEEKDRRIFSNKNSLTSLQDKTQYEALETGGKKTEEKIDLVNEKYDYLANMFKPTVPEAPSIVLAM